MSDFPEPLQKHLNTFVNEIKIDEREDEKRRLQKHLDLIEAKIIEAFRTIKVEVSPSKPPQSKHVFSVPMPWFLLLGAWALAATLALSFVLGSSYPGLVNTEPVLDPVETQAF
jgi:hypothetical protein